MISINRFKYIVVCLLIVLALLFVIKSVASREPLAPMEITIATAPYQAFGLLFVALKNGYFADENLEVNVRTFSLGKDALADVEAGNSTLATVYQAPFVTQVDAGQDLAIISSLHKAKKATGIIANKRRGINTFLDLEGKKIGVVQGTASESLVNSLLSNYNLKKDVVKVVQYKDSKQLEADFTKGDLDAISLFQPNLYLAINNFNTDDITVIYSPVYLENSVLAGYKQLILDQPEKMRRVLRALDKAEEYATNHKEESREIIKAALPQGDSATVDPLWDTYEMTLTIDNVLLNILEKESVNFSDPKSEEHDFRENIIPDYLREVDEKNVTLFK